MKHSLIPEIHNEESNNEQTTVQPLKRIIHHSKKKSLNREREIIKEEEPSISLEGLLIRSNETQSEQIDSLREINEELFEWKEENLQKLHELELKEMKSSYELEMERLKNQITDLRREHEIDHLKSDPEKEREEKCRTQRLLTLMTQKYQESVSLYIQKTSNSRFT